MKYKTPVFINEGTFSWDQLGYFYSHAPSLSAEFLETDSNAPWGKFIHALQLAKEGKDFSLSELIGLIKPDSDPAYIRAALAFIADAGESSEMRDQFRPFLIGGGDYIRLEACWAIRTAGLFWLIPDMLDAFQLGGRDSDRASIAMNISMLLEDDSSSLSSPEDYTPDEYSRLVLSRYENLKSKFDDTEVLVWRGNEYGVIELAKEMRNLLTRDNVDPRDLQLWFVTLRHRFEASTGINCASFFKDKKLQPSFVLGIIDKFLSARPEEKFLSRARYFFGHKINV